MLDPHGALIYTMVIVTGAESGLPADEIAIIGDIVGHLPVFRTFDRGKLGGHLNACADLLGNEDGLDEIRTHRNDIRQSGGRDRNDVINQASLGASA